MKLGGKERQLRYDLNAIAEVGERLGIEVRLDQLGSDLLDKPLPLSALRIILWAGLRHEDDTLTPEDVGAWVDQDNIGEVMQCFFSLFGKTSSAPNLSKLADAMDGTGKDSPLPTSSASPTEPLASRPANSGV